MQDHYEVLGVSPSAPVSVIKAAYRQLCKEHHPDAVSSSGSHQRMQALNEAHSVLTDQSRRSEYDRLHKWQGGFTRGSTEEAASSENGATSPVPLCACAKCGRQNATLRITVFAWVVSVVVLSRRRYWNKILCAPCRVKYGLLFNLEVLLLGFWSVPWGVIWSITALLRNASGRHGVELDHQNAAFLRELGRGFLIQGRNVEALRGLRSSLRLREDAMTATLLGEARRRVPAGAVPSGWARLIAFELPPALYHSLALGLLWLGVVGLNAGTHHAATPKSLSANRPFEIKPARVPALAPGTPGTNAATGTGVSLELAELVRRHRQAVVTLSVSDTAGREIATGTGFFVSPLGNVITNHHVIKNAAYVVVRLADGREFLAGGTLADSADTDLAMLWLERNAPMFAGLGAKLVGPGGTSFVEPPEQLPWLKLGDSRAISVGERLAVIGSPIGLEGTVSEGILSAEREVDGRRLLQLTASLSPGSSGSPVLDGKGEVVGVATIASRSGLQQINFAVAAEEVATLVASASSATAHFSAFRPEIVPTLQASPTATDKIGNRAATSPTRFGTQIAPLEAIESQMQRCSDDVYPILVRNGMPVTLSEAQAQANRVHGAVGLYVDLFKQGDGIGYRDIRWWYAVLIPALDKAYGINNIESQKTKSLITRYFDLKVERDKLKESYSGVRVP